MVSWKPLAAAAIALFAAGYSAGNCGKFSNAALDAAHDSTAAVHELAIDAEAARILAEIRARSDSLHYAAIADSALAAARAAASRRPRVVERIVERAGSDSAVVRVAVQEAVDSIVTYEVMPLEAARMAQDSLYAAQAILLRATDEARLRAQEGLQKAIYEIGMLRDARPSWLQQHAAKLAVPAALAAGWYLRGRLQ